MALIYDLVDPVELQGFIRNLPAPQFGLAAYLPGRNVADLEFRFTKGELDEPDAAPYRAFDAEAAIGRRPGAARVSGELPPLSAKYRLGEEQRLRLQQLGRLPGGDASALVDAVFDDARRGTLSVLARIELARGQALFDGKVTIAENGVAAEVDFGFGALPAAGTFTSQRAVVATSWADPAADVIGNLTAMVEAYVTRTGGERPGVLLTSTRVRNALLRNTAIRTLAGSLAGAPGLVTVDTLNATLAAFDLPQIAVYDTMVKSGGVRTRIFPDDRALLLPAGGAGSQLGATFFGVTAEALELVGAQQLAADQAPGLTAVVEKTFDPVATWTKVAAIGIPVLANPELVTTARVIL